jgi:hypothetical protein
MRNRAVLPGCLHGGSLNGLVRRVHGCLPDGSRGGLVRRVPVCLTGGFVLARARLLARWAASVVRFDACLAAWMARSVLRLALSRLAARRLARWFVLLRAQLLARRLAS